MYVLRAFVPDSDKDTVKVRIQGDRAVVAGARSFVEKMEEDGKKLSTNSYQTFQEEFKFDHPVAQNAISQQRDGDFLEFVIPKIGFVDKKV
jgi:HSP20 family molecular chaperone IbpA